MSLIPAVVWLGLWLCRWFGRNQLWWVMHFKDWILGSRDTYRLIYILVSFSQFSVSSLYHPIITALYMKVLFGLYNDCFPSLDTLLVTTSLPSSQITLQSALTMNSAAATGSVFLWADAVMPHSLPGKAVPTGPTFWTAVSRLAGSACL